MNKSLNYWNCSKKSFIYILTALFFLIALVAIFGFTVISNKANTATSASRIDLPDGIYTVHPVAVFGNNMSFDISGGSRENGARVQLFTNNNTYAQHFHFKKDTDSNSKFQGFYEIININSNKAFDLAGANAVNGGVIHQWDRNNSCAQR